MSRFINIADLRRAAERRLPRVAFDYIDGGADGEVTLRENTRVGSSCMFYPRGEEVAARAAGEAGTGYILSTLSGCHVNDVKAASRGPVWYQLYLMAARMRSSYRITVAASLMASPRRSKCCRKSCPPQRARWKSCLTATFGAAVMW